MIQNLRSWLSPHTDSNPYASPATMRALDSLIRSQVADQIARAAARFRGAYAEGHARLGHPSREAPLPDSAALEALRSLKAKGDRLSNLSAAVSALPAPANDRVWQRVRDHRNLLELLIEYDYTLVAESRKLGPWAEAALLSGAGGNDLESALAPIQRTLRERSDLLLSVP